MVRSIPSPLLTSFLSLRNSPEAIEDGDGVDADAEACIPERDKRRVEAANEGLEGLLRGLVQVDDGVGSDQKCSVGPFVTVKAGVVHNLLLGQGVGLQLSVHFCTEPDGKISMIRRRCRWRHWQGCL